MVLLWWIEFVPIGSVSNCMEFQVDTYLIYNIKKTNMNNL